MGGATPPQSSGVRISDGPPHRLFPWHAFVPGWSQFRSGRPELGLLILSTFASALVSSLLTWGTVLSFAFLVAAFLTHSASAADAIVTAAFPGFRRRVVMISVSIVLAAGAYLPGASACLRRGFPAWQSRPLMGGFLVDLSAYRDARPQGGQHVWLKPTGWSRPQLARVLATSGQEVAIRKGVVFVGGRAVEGATMRNAQAGDTFALSVPDDHLLVAYQSADDPEMSLPANWELIPETEVVGHAWARTYPIWNRRLLN